MERRYLLVCRGPTCKTQGADDVREKLRRALAATAVENRGDRVTVLPYTCFDHCGRGPNAVLYPDGVWLEALESDDVAAVAAFVNGGAVPIELLATVNEDHAQDLYDIFDETIPALEREARRAEEPPRKRRWPF